MRLVSLVVIRDALSLNDILLKIINLTFFPEAPENQCLDLSSRSNCFHVGATYTDKNWIATVSRKKPLANFMIVELGMTPKKNRASRMSQRLSLLSSKKVICSDEKASSSEIMYVVFNSPRIINIAIELFCRIFKVPVNTSDFLKVV